MEKAKKTTLRSANRLKEAIKEGYKEFLLTEGKQPLSVYAFCKKIRIKEQEFYKYFSSFDSIERAIWSDHVVEVSTRLTSDKNYESFSAREKTLSFYFGLFESLKRDRSFLIIQLKLWRNPAFPPEFLRGFGRSFTEWAKPIIEVGIQSGEIAKRPYVDQYYEHLLSMHLLFVLQFWTHDQSADFEHTDAAIEKSVNLAFDLIGKGLLDNALDFGKFLYQTYKN